MFLMSKSMCLLMRRRRSPPFLTIVQTADQMEETDWMLPETRTDVRNSRSQYGKNLSLCYCIFGTLCLLTTVWISNQRLSPMSDFLKHFIPSRSHFTASRSDYLLSMEKLSKDRALKFGTNITYRWLFLTIDEIYRQMMDRHFFSMYEAAKRHPNINATLWGRDFPGYDTSKLLIENIRLRFGSLDYFDLIYQTDPMFMMTDMRAASQHTPIMYRDHECWGYRCLPGIIDANISIYLQTFAYEMDLYHTSFSYNRVFAHSPATAEPLVFYPPLVLNTDTPPVRDIDVLVVGARDPFVYPIRAQIAGLIAKGRIKNGYVHEHPGYDFANSTYEKTQAQLYSYAALLRRAKIVVSDSARYGYALGKYSEVPLSGCLVLGDIPAEREDEFRTYVAEISMNMTDDEIVSIVDYWIAHDDERETRAQRGQNIVLRSYTWDHNIDIALEAALRYRRQHYGFMHKYPYTTTCAPIDNIWVQQPTLNQWCSNRARTIPFRSWCQCNLTQVNFLKEEQDLDNWLGNGLDADPANPRAYFVPSSFLVTCVGEETAEVYAKYTPFGSVCYCKHADGRGHPSDVCYVSNAALSISRHLVYVETHAKKI